MEMLTFHSAAQLYHQFLLLKGYAKRTIDSYLWHLKPFLSWLKHHNRRSLNSISKSDLEHYFTSRYYFINKYGKHNGIKSRNTEILVIKQLFKLLNQKGHLSNNPALDIHYIKKTSLLLPKNILSTHQLKKLLKQPDTSSPLGYRDRLILELLIATAIRRQELVQLNLDDINLQQRVITIRQPKGNSDRVVPINKTAALYLHRYLKHFRPLIINGLSINNAPSKKLLKKPFKKRSPSDQQPLILSYTAKRITGGRVASIVSLYANQANLKNVSPHTIRHSIATHLIQNGMSIRLLQELLGHNSLQSTISYLNLNIKSLKSEFIKSHPRA